MEGGQKVQTSNYKYLAETRLLSFQGNDGIHNPGTE